MYIYIYIYVCIYIIQNKVNNHDLVFNLEYIYK